ncbi:hypothetical protein Tco_1196250 [Tanacetum coccineum]
MISLVNKNTLAEYMITSGVTIVHPMLTKTCTIPWKIEGIIHAKKEHRRNDTESVETCSTYLAKQLKTTVCYFDELVNNHKVAKYLWEKIQLLMQGTSLTKREREYEHGAVLSQYQVLKRLHTWNRSKFMTDSKLVKEFAYHTYLIKLVKDLHTTNFDQLHAYLEQHEFHANEVRFLCERNQDLLAIIANQQMTPPHFNTYQSSYNNPQLQQQFPPSRYGLIHPNQHYSSTYPSQPQLNHLSVPPSYPYQA